MCAKEKVKLHPSVSQFKEFVQKHPKIVKDVRNGNKTWQQLYQDWFLVGESDEIWNEYRSEEEIKELEDSQEEKPNSQMLGKVMSFFRNIDPEQMQGQMNNLQNIATNIQQLVGIFRGTEQSNESEIKQQNPFTFQND